ncbi:hypothetical protein ACIQJT_40600 [Streptomyces sp. NPDC091972]|uniref:hypothetical protein n=1 Tax=Streptomyces sp. NPDC091972 TaxID=3366007 RepID=UPI0038157818
MNANTPGLTWKYAYSGDRLISVCPPASATKCTVYAYADGSVYRSGVLDSAPTSYGGWARARARRLPAKRSRAPA